MAKKLNKRCHLAFGWKSPTGFINPKQALLMISCDTSDATVFEMTQKTAPAGLVFFGTLNNSENLVKAIFGDADGFKN